MVLRPSPAERAASEPAVGTWRVCAERLDAEASSRGGTSLPSHYGRGRWYRRHVVRRVTLPSTTALALNVFLRSNHRTMPNLIIAPDDADRIIAYILSLKRD